MVQAMQMLHVATSAKDPAMLPCLETADEAALRKLGQRTEELAPALQSLRTEAVDQGVFSDLRKKMTQTTPKRVRLRCKTTLQSSQPSKRKSTWQMNQASSKRKSMTIQCQRRSSLVKQVKTRMKEKTGPQSNLSARGKGGG